MSANRRATIATTTKPSSSISSSTESIASLTESPSSSTESSSPLSSAGTKKRSSYVGHHFKLVKIALGLKKPLESTEDSSIDENISTNVNTNTNINTENTTTDNTTTNNTNNTNSNITTTITDTHDIESLQSEELEEVHELKVTKEEIELLRAEVLIKEKLLNELIDNVKTLKQSTSVQINQIDHLVINNVHGISNNDIDNMNEEDDLRLLREKLSNIRSRREKVIDPLREEAISLNEALTDTRNNLSITKEKLIESEKVEKNLKSFYGTLCGIFSEAQSDLSNLKIEIKKNMISDSKRRPSVSVSETEQSKKPTALACVVDYMRISYS